MTRNAASLLGVFLAFVCVFGGLPIALAEEPADAERAGESVKTAYELSQEIEAAQAAYSSARAEVDQASEAVLVGEARIAAIEREIPLQQERSSDALRELYKFQRQGAGIVELLLGSGDFRDFLSELEYANRIAGAYLAEIGKLAQMRGELQEMQAELRESRADADARADHAQAVLAVAQEAQAEALRRIEEEARLEAEVAAATAAMEAPRDNDVGTVEDEAPEAAPATPGVSEQPSAVEAPSDEAAFVGLWAPRIDAYLAGSPLAGQGAVFARAAYAYGVDPRWSPAISAVESSKGRACFKPHNAWGWGSSSWASWEEAIDAHVRGLARGYGYTISPEAARKYCPPNWEFWYNKTLAQMEMI